MKLGRKLALLALGALVGPMLLAATGGFPSRPRFQVVGVGASPSATIPVNVSSSNGQLGLWDSTGANGGYLTFSRSGVQKSDVGIGLNCGGSFTADSLCLVGRAGNALEMAAGGRGAPDIQITSAGAINLNQLTTLSIGATAQTAVFSSTAAAGPYFTFSRSGTGKSDIGVGTNCGGSFTADSLCLTARTGNNTEISAGGRTSPDIQITSAGAINLNQPTTVGTLTVSTSATVGGSAVCRADGTNCPSVGGTKCSTACNVSTIAVGQAFYINPTATATRTSTATSTSDADLQFTNVPVGTYEISQTLIFTGSTGGSRVTYALTSGTGQAETAGTQACLGVASTAVALGSSSLEVTCASSTTNYITGNGFARIATTATIALQWSQNISNATPTTRTADSYIVLTRVK